MKETFTFQFGERFFSFFVCERKAKLRDLREKYYNYYEILNNTVKRSTKIIIIIITNNNNYYYE